MMFYVYIMANLQILSLRVIYNYSIVYNYMIFYVIDCNKMFLFMWFPSYGSEKCVEQCVSHVFGICKKSVRMIC